MVLQDGKGYATGRAARSRLEGVVSRRGRAANPEGAKVVKELVVRPIEGAVDDSVWRAIDGTEFDTDALAARVIALLEEQI